MAAIFLFLLLSSFSTLVTSQQTQSNISLGSSISPTKNPTSWLSPSGRFAFGFYPEGNGYGVGIWLVETPETTTLTVVWTFNRDDPPVSANSTLRLKADDGNLVLQTGQAQEKVISDGAVPAASYASMLDSGNFVLYDLKSQIIWGTFNSPTDTILSGQRLLSGSQLFSSISESNHSSGRFRLNMQAQGNLVLSPIKTMDNGNDAYWVSNTSGLGNNVILNLNEDGVLYLLDNNTGSTILNVTKGGFSTERTSVYRATLDVDGVFRLYSHGFVKHGSSTTQKVWEALDDKCKVKGFCGLNGYCSQQDCLCPRGFDYIDPKQRFLGCAKNFAYQLCRINRGNVQYFISAMENTVWLESNPYVVLSPITREGCSNACLEDCICEAALFTAGTALFNGEINGGTCSKQKLPLRYGRKDMGDSTTAFIKYGTGNSASIDGNSFGETDGVDNRSRENGRSKEVRVDVLIISLALIAISFICFAFLGFLIYKHRLGRYRKISDQNSISLTEEIALQSFSYKELEKATDGFKEELGRGAFGTVFKGALFNNKRVVAIKRLEKVAEEGEREFRTEVRAIGRTHHKNLVRLLGFCDDSTHKLLVYEFMRNGSLANLLFKPERRPNWHERVEIALDVARGILYLHEECETQIIHCDIKPQNILMDEFHLAKISDFGLAKLMKPDQTRTFTGIRGTRGYVAPEWHKNMAITVKVDVYSFGIVLLEIICCRRSVEMEVPEDEIVLSDWVYDCFEAGQLGTLVNGEAVDKRRFERMVKIGLWCIQDEPSLRPSMKKVVLMLEGTVDIPVPPSPNSFLSAL